MQNLTQSGLSVNKVNSGSISAMNGGGTNNIFVTNNGATTIPDNFIFEQVDPSLEEDDSDSDTTGFGQVNQGHGFQQGPTNTGLKPGKKTKGRVKIKMEFIQNKLRRYTTFSKRKTGIMKKAYELSTLTGTQVMLLVASETGHVYTFATRKLQPMITSESGKALIQTCLNSPDPLPGTPSERMNPSGFEETDLSCAVGEDEQPKIPDTMKPVFPMPTQVSSAPQQEQHSVAQPVREVASVNQIVSQVPSFTLQPVQTASLAKEEPTVTATSRPLSVSSSTTVANNSSINNNNNTSSSFPTMHLPVIFQQGTTISMLQPNSQSLNQGVTVTQSTQSQNVLKPASLSQVVSALNNSQTISSSQNNQTGELNTPLPVSTPSAINIMQGMTPGIVMYHTPQGVVYATPTQNIHDRTVFNFPQPAQTISMSQPDQSTGQQIITIPVPVSLSGTPLLQLAPPPSVESSSQGDSAPPLKKAKK